MRAPTASRSINPDSPAYLADGVPMAVDRLENIVSLSKRRGFVFPSSEIYGGLRASWDYGPLGVELKITSSASGGSPWSWDAKMLSDLIHV